MALRSEDLEKKLDTAHIEDTGPHLVSIANPLKALSREELLFQVDDFVDHYGLQADRDIIKRGALLGQHHEDIEGYLRSQTGIESAEKEITLGSASGSSADAPSNNSEGASKGTIPQSLVYSEEEVRSLLYERDHPWRSLSFSMVMSAIVAAFGAWTQGADQQANSAAVLGWTQVFGLDAPEGTKNNQRDNWLTGLTSSGPQFGAFMCSVWFADILNQKLGRRGTLMLAAVFCIAAPIGSAGCNHWYQLFIVRLLMGLGMGTKEVTSPVFSAENAPTMVRGTLVMFWQLFTAFGIAFHAGLNIALGPRNFASTDKKWKGYNLSWRYQSAFAALPAIALALTIYACPESPRWLISKRKLPQAWKSLQRLRYRKINAAKDFYHLYVQLLEEEAAIGKRGNYFRRFAELFYRNRIRQATLATFVVMMAQQLCGINIIAYFAGNIFDSVIHDSQKTLWATFGFGMINFFFAFPALYTIDTFGRRPLLLITFPLMFIFLLTAGLCMLIHTGKVKLGLVALFIYLFTAVYSPGEGPVPFTYSAEAFPISHREVGMAWAVFTNNFFGTVLSITFFRIYAAMTPTGAFGFYAGLNVIAWIMIILWVPETKQLSLEELDAVFAVSTKKFMRYSLTTEMPYRFRRYLLFDKRATLPPLELVDHY